MLLAVNDWHIIECRAIDARIWGVPGAPESLMDLDPVVFLAFVEGLCRNDEDTAKMLDKMWAESKPKPAVAQSKPKRRSDIREFINAVVGGQLSA